MKLRVFESVEQVAAYSSQTLEEIVSQAAPGRVAVALSGGSTPKRIFEYLVRHCATTVDWTRLEVFFGDERAVPPGDSASNYRSARELLLDHVPIPPENVHRMEAEDADLDAAAARYEATLRRRVAGLLNGVPRFDLIWLGLGEDGHTASLFPGTRALEENDRLVVANDVPQLDTRRMTMTFPLLRGARRVQVIATGEAKAARMAQLASGEASFPAARLQLADGSLEWVLDRAAASELPTTS